MKSMQIHKVKGKAGEASPHFLLPWEVKAILCVGSECISPHLLLGQVLWPSQLACCCVSANNSGWVPSKLAEYEPNFCKTLVAHNEELWCARQGRVILTGSASEQLTWHPPIPLEIRGFLICSWKRDLPFRLHRWFMQKVYFGTLHKQLMSPLNTVFRRFS